MAMGILVVVVLAFVWLYSGFTVSPGRADTSQAVAPTADVTGNFDKVDRTLDFTAVVPVGVPADWDASSWSTTRPGNAEGKPATARGGWLTPDGRFITLIQSSGTTPALLSSEFGHSAVSADTVQAGGASWQVATGVRNEVAWVRELDGVTLLITGTAPEADFQALAATLP